MVEELRIVMHEIEKEVREYHDKRLQLGLYQTRFAREKQAEKEQWAKDKRKQVISHTEVLMKKFKETCNMIRLEQEQIKKAKEENLKTVEEQPAIARQEQLLKAAQEEQLKKAQEEQLKKAQEEQLKKAQEEQLKKAQEEQLSKEEQEWGI